MRQVSIGDITTDAVIEREAKRRRALASENLAIKRAQP